MWNAIHLFFAGSWGLIWHWGLGVGVIVLCIAGAVLTDAIPVIGPWLGRERKWLLFIAAITGAILVGELIGGYDQLNRCRAKTVVIEKIVTKAVDRAKSSTKADRYDDPNN